MKDKFPDGCAMDLITPCSSCNTYSRIQSLGRECNKRVFWTHKANNCFSDPIVPLRTEFVVSRGSGLSNWVKEGNENENLDLDVDGNSDLKGIFTLGTDRCAMGDLFLALPLSGGYCSTHAFSRQNHGTTKHRKHESVSGR